MNPHHAAFALAGVSASLLAYELLLMRLFALAEWGHLAGFIISIAMLGLAASSLLLHRRREQVRQKPIPWLSASAGWFGITAPTAIAVAQTIPFNPFLLVWSVHEYYYLTLRIVLLFVPFFCGGLALGTLFVARMLPASRLYCWSMVGAALPGTFLAWGMTYFHPVRLLMLTAGLASASAVLLANSRRTRVAWGSAGLVVCLGIAFMPFHYSPYKDLSKTLTLPDTRILATSVHPRGVVHTVASSHTRYLPGLSLNFNGELPPAQLLFVDASNMEIVFDARQALAKPEFLLSTPEAFAYELHRRPTVLLLNGTTTDLLRALAGGAGPITWTDDLPARALARNQIWARFGFSPLASHAIVLAETEARHFLQADTGSFDLIQFPLLGSHAAASAGAASLDPSFALTTEAFALLFRRIKPEGELVLTTWIENPPRAGPRLAALLIQSLRQGGIQHPSRHLLAIRSFATLTFFVSLHPYEPPAVERLKSFAQRHAFDLVHYPGITLAEANRYNEIPGAPYFTAIHALLHAPPETLLREAPFHVDPPTDNRPFFGHYFRWKALPSLISTLGRTWLPYVEWGYLLQSASFLLCALLGGLFLVLPCALTRTRPTLGTGTLFFLLGVAYMLIELWAIYKLTYFLSSPILASTTVLTSMLAASGAGALLLNRGQGTTRNALLRVSVCLVLALLLALGCFELCHATLFKCSWPIRFLSSALWIALPAFFMGFPYPFALENTRRAEEIAWALALNGLGSVLGSLGAVLIAVHFGLAALALSGMVCYAIVAGLLHRLPAASFSPQH